MRRRSASRLLANCSLLALLGHGAEVSAAFEAGRPDPAKIVGPQTCGECHLSAFELWKTTRHETGFKTLHRKESAAAIAGRMGFRLIKRDSLCLRCHYTAQENGGQLKAIEGVSCESCHGSARDWVRVHNDYGAGADRLSENAAHREQRIERSRLAGMHRPSDLYEVAASCFRCHTVPEERLVDVGGHTTGSAGFELVEWSQGRMRHNFLRSFLEGDGTENVERPLERRRWMYLVGRLVELEYALRGLAVAESDGVYAKAMTRKVRGALGEVRAIAGRLSLPEVGAVVGAVREARIVPGDGETLLQLANRVQSAGKAAAAARESVDLAALDPLMLGLAEAEEEAPAPAELAGADGEPGVDSGAVARAATGGTVTTVASTSRGGKAAQGELKSRLRPPSSRATLGPGACAGCHTPQNESWFQDPHYSSADPFFDQRPANVMIARLYGLDAAKLTRGGALCMDCHGTVITGKERREVLDGVGCEACHGPSADYNVPHREGERSEGLGRAGYRRGLELGLAKLRDASTLAAQCASCHYITDPRLLSAGHTSGASFDLRVALPRVKHWQVELPGLAQLAAAYDAVVARRGPVPAVELARLPQSAEQQTLEEIVEQRPAKRPRVVPPRPLSGRAGPSGAVVADSAVPWSDLEPLDPKASIEERLLEIAARLVQLHQLYGRE